MTIALSFGMNQRNLRKNQNKKYAVRPLNMDGSVSKMKMTKYDWQVNAFATMEQASLRKSQLEALNAHTQFAIVSL